MTTYNIYGLCAKRPDLCMILDREEPAIVALQETLISELKCRLWLPRYTNIERKMVQKMEPSCLAFLVRRDMGFTLSEIKSDHNFVAGVI